MRRAPSVRRHADDLATILAAVARQPPEPDVDNSAGDRQGRPLLVRPRIVPGQVDDARPADGAGGGIEREQHVLRPPDLGDDEDRAGSRVVGGRARDPERVDVAARQRGQGHRCADVPAPLDPPTPRVEGVDGVSLGGSDDPAADDDRLPVDRPVEERRPGPGRVPRGGEGGIDTGAGGVAVVHGPVGRRRRRGRGGGLGRGGSWGCQRPRSRRGARCGALRSARARGLSLRGCSGWRRRLRRRRGSGSARGGAGRAGRGCRRRGRTARGHKRRHHDHGAGAPGTRGSPGPREVAEGNANDVVAAGARRFSMHSRMVARPRTHGRQTLSGR